MVAPPVLRACSQALVAELSLVKQAVKVPLVEVLALVKEVHEHKQDAAHQKVSTPSHTNARSLALSSRSPR